jgi:acetolactate synthase-1/2/3 large subunit
MTGGDAIVGALIQGGVDTVFTLPGVQIYGLVDALARAGGAVRVFAPRHEQAAAYMALGYAKSTGRTGVYAVVPGPGMLNSAAGLSAAYAGSTPVVCVTGQVPSRFLGAGLGHLHEMPDQLATMRTMTKWAERIGGPADAPALVAEALHQARNGRPLPVALEMAWDRFDQRADVAFPAPAACEPTVFEPTVPPGPGDLEQAAELLAAARNPMLMVGSGAFGAAAQVLELAERLQAPVVSYRSGRGIVPSDHYLGFSCAEGFARWRETDVVVGIGSRLELLWYRWPDHPGNPAVIDINVDPEHARRVGAAVGLVGDAAPATTALARLLADVKRPSRRAEFEALKAARNDEIRRLAPYAEHLAAIRAVLPRDGFFVDEMCQAGFASCYAFPVYQPRTFVSFGGFGALGQGYPTALGVKAAHPDRAVVSISGDGGFQFALQELATAMQYGLDVVAIVFNNQAYGNVLRDQENSYDGRVLGAALRNPDFVALARSYGMHAERAETPARLAAALDRALERREPALIEVPADPRRESSPWSFIQPPEPASGLGLVRRLEVRLGHVPPRVRDLGGGLLDRGDQPLGVGTLGPGTRGDDRDRRVDGVPGGPDGRGDGPDLRVGQAVVDRVSPPAHPLQFVIQLVERLEPAAGVGRPLVRLWHQGPEPLLRRPGEEHLPAGQPRPRREAGSDGVVGGDQLVPVTHVDMHAVPAVEHVEDGRLVHLVAQFGENRGRDRDDAPRPRDHLEPGDARGDPVAARIAIEDEEVMGLEDEQHAPHRAGRQPELLADFRQRAGGIGDRERPKHIQHPLRGAQRVHRF